MNHSTYFETWRICDDAFSDAPTEANPTSRCWLLTGRDYERVTLQPSGQEIPKCRDVEGMERRFELPAGVGSEGLHSETLNLILEKRDGSLLSISYERAIDITRRIDDRREIIEGASQIERDSQDAINAIGRHIELITTASEEVPADPLRRVTSGPVIPLPFEQFVDTWNKAMAEDEARYALIVRIALEVSGLVEDLFRRPRRVLRRERFVEKLDRVSQVDPACLRWISRQPGRTIAEKAGPRQRILGVIRVENADTPENRVLRDFAIRAIRAADAYVNENRQFSNNARVIVVRRFRSLLRRLLRETEIGRVSNLVGVPEPNYVLMFDARYKEMWRWYLKLRRLQQEQEDLWRWRHRLWSEIVFCNSLIAFDRLANQTGAIEPLARSFVLIRQEPQDGNASGRFVDPSSPLPVFVLCGSTPRIVEVTDVDHPGLWRAPDARFAKLLTLNPDFVFIVSQVTSPNSDQHIFGIWTEFTPTEDQKAIVQATTRLKEHISALNCPGVSGLLIHPAKNELDESQGVEDFDYLSGDEAPIVGCRLPMNQARAVEFLTKAYDLLLQSDT